MARGQRGRSPRQHVSRPPFDTSVWESSRIFTPTVRRRAHSSAGGDGVGPLRNVRGHLFSAATLVACPIQHQAVDLSSAGGPS